MIFTRIHTIVLITLLCMQLPQAMCAEFVAGVQSILESACLSCHSGENAEGELRLDTLANAVRGGVSGAALVSGKPEESPLYKTTLLPADHEQAMPPDGPRLSEGQTKLLEQWIRDGANWPVDVVLKAQPRIDFAEDVQPILEKNCVSCHRSDNKEGDYDLTSFDVATPTSRNLPGITPFQPQASLLYTLMTLSADDEERMPPAGSGDPLPVEDLEKVRLWIAQGAVWPKEIVLKPRAKSTYSPDSPDNMELVRRIHAKIVKQSQEESNDPMQDYQQSIPRTGATYSMVAIPGGSFLMGSPESEAERKANEGPQRKVSVDPFWMGKYEVTWDEYEPFMVTKVDRRKDGSRLDFEPAIHSDVDAVSGPTAPYIEMSFGMGQKGYPAISMTQHAANKYCQWLSAQTGHFYRLPTEAEWEYACRAGSTTAYHFGDNSSLLGEYAWFYDNSNEKYQKVGKKKPNAWGLYDMHGNVSEWTADQYKEDYFQLLGEQNHNPFLSPQTLYPRTVRGGNWDDDPDRVRSASRIGSDPVWKQQDPQLPKSIWYHTDARWLGFRIIRPLKIPDVEEMYFFWNSATKKN